MRKWMCALRICVCVNYVVYGHALLYDYTDFYVCIVLLVY
jgi:hypothetical protein